MPGIVGLITKMPREWAEPQLLRMVQALRHEPFYKIGTWMDEPVGVYAGWVAREKSFSDGMPLCNERGDVALLFSGEEYPKKGTASRLKQAGHALATNCPASYLVHLAEEDPDFPTDLNGRFQGLLADRTRGTAMLFNDRYGMHRIYYHESKEAFYFAAEAKAILAVRPELKRVVSRSLGEFITCGCVLENRTLFEGIHLLPPASRWVFRGGSAERKSNYFQPREWEEQAPLEPDVFYQDVREAFSRNLERYFNGQQPLGISLTGGLDTRMIMAWHKAPKGSLPCYTFGGPFRDCQDVQVARKIAKACGQPHKVIPVGNSFLSRFSHYAEKAVYLADGTVQVGRAADLYANELARLIAPVRMTGNYGSEVLRWTPAFKPGNGSSGLFRPELRSHLDAASNTYASVVRGHPVSFAVFRQAPWYHNGLLSLEQTQLSVRTPYLDNDFVRAVFRAPTPSLSRRDTKNVDLCLRLVTDGDAALARIRTDRGLGGNGGLPSKGSRAFQEFTFKAEYAYDYGMPQWVARIDHTFSNLHLERIFLGRHKFVHYRVWYRDALAKYVSEMLLDSRTLSRPYLMPKAVETVVRGHLKEGRNYTSEIHQLLTLELLHRLFIDSQ